MPETLRECLTWMLRPIGCPGPEDTDDEGFALWIWGMVRPERAAAATLFGDDGRATGPPKAPGLPCVQPIREEDAQEIGRLLTDMEGVVGDGGHFTIFRFTTNWKVMLGTPNDVHFACWELPGSESLLGALKYAIANRPRASILEEIGEAAFAAEQAADHVKTLRAYYADPEAAEDTDA